MQGKFLHLVQPLGVLVFPAHSAVAYHSAIAVQWAPYACTMAKTVPNFQPAASVPFYPFGPIHPTESVGLPLEFQYNDVANGVPSFRPVAA